MTPSKTIQQAVDKQLDRQSQQLNHAVGLKTVKVLVRLDKEGKVEEVVLTHETSSEWGEGGRSQ